MLILTPQVLLFLVGSLADASWSEDIQGQLQLRHLERREEQHKAAGMDLRLRLGLFRDISQNFSWGFEITSAGSRPLGSAPLGDRMQDKSLALSQAALEWKQPQWGLEVTGGKFLMPFPTSPLLWNKQLRPEGFTEAWSFQFSQVTARMRSAQLVLDRMEAHGQDNSKSLRSWLFIHGFEFLFEPYELTQARLAANWYHIHGIPPDSFQEARARGNRPQLSEDEGKLKSDFLPLEAVFEIESRVFAVLTSLKAAAALNFGSDNYQRGFFVQGRLGKPWTRYQFLLSAAYIYLEPDLQVAYLTDPWWGYTNRQGPQLELHWYPYESIRLGSSLSLLQVLEETAYQKDRIDWTAEVEYRF